MALTYILIRPDLPTLPLRRVPGKVLSPLFPLRVIQEPFSLGHLHILAAGRPLYIFSPLRIPVFHIRVIPAILEIHLFPGLFCGLDFKTLDTLRPLFHEDFVVVIKVHVVQRTAHVSAFGTVLVHGTVDLLGHCHLVLFRVPRTEGVLVCLLCYVWDYTAIDYIFHDIICNVFRKGSLALLQTREHTFFIRVSLQTDHFCIIVMY